MENSDDKKTWHEEIIKMFDFYTQTLNIRLNEKEKSKTVCGAVVSIIIILLFFLLVLYLLIDLTQKKNQFFTSNNLRYEDPPFFNITPDISQSSDNNEPFFFFSLAFYDNSNIDISLEELDKYFYIELQLQYLNTTSKVTKITNVYSMISCESKFYSSLEYFNMLKSFNNSTKTVKFTRKYYCINETLFEVGGDFVSIIYKYFSLKIKKCSNNPSPTKNCENNQNHINSFINKLNIDLVYSYYYIENLILNDIPLKYFTKTEKFKLSQNYYYKKDLYLSYSLIESAENLFLKFYGILSRRFITSQKTLLNYASVSSTYYALYLRSSYDYLYIFRNYKTFFVFISQLGGIWKFLVIIGSVLISKSNLKLMLNRLGNYIFVIISPANLDIIKRKENLDYYKSQGNDNFPNEFITSNNKSDKEAEIYLDIFKYERNKGLEISMNEVVLHNYFSSCLNKKNRNTMKLADQVEMEVVEKLDILKVLIFIKQFNYMKQMTFSKQSFLLGINRNNTLVYSNLKSLINKNKRFTMQISDDPIEMAKKRNEKEKKFLKGIRYYKVKPVLDKKIDYKILNMYKWNKKIISNYFRLKGDAEHYDE